MFCFTLVLVILILTDGTSSGAVYDSDYNYVDLQGSSDFMTGNVVLAPFAETVGSFSCTDSDGGFNPGVKGTYFYSNLRTKKNVSRTDVCRDSNYLTEYSCVVRTRSGAKVSVVPVVNNSVLCPEGCENGACKSSSVVETEQEIGSNIPVEPIYVIPGNNTNLTINIYPNSTNLTNCIDLDSGLNYYEATKAIGPYGATIESAQLGWIWGEESDKCSARFDESLGTSVSYDCCSDSENFNQLNEAFCASDKLMSSYGYSCPYGCEKGVCLTNAPVTDTIKDGETKTYTVNGFDYEVTAVLISNNTNYYSTKVSVNGVMTRELSANEREKLPNGVAVGISSIYGNAVTFYLRPDEKVPGCYDSDGGSNYFEFGIANVGKTNLSDTCQIKVFNGQNDQYNLASSCEGENCYVGEAICDENAYYGNTKGLRTDLVNCPAGCKDGACKQITPNCIDFDSGSNYYIASNAQGVTSLGLSYNFVDSCCDYLNGGCSNTGSPTNYLNEAYCSPDNYPSWDTKLCDYGCSNGVCLNSKTACLDSDKGNIADLKGFLTYHPDDKLNGWNNVPDVCGIKNNDGNYDHKPSCSGSDCYVIESYCSSDAPARDFISCSQGCNDGACAKSFDLSQYPELFIKDGLLNGVIVVGEKAPANEVVEAINLQASLNVPNGNAKLDNDVNNFNQNIISIGSPCTNTVSSKLSGNPEECASGMSPGVGRITLYTYNGYAHMVVEGYGPTELTAAVNALIYYKNSGLSGTLFIVKAPSSACTDTDYGVNNFIKGITTITKFGQTLEKQTDSCVLRSGLQRTPVFGFFLDIISTPNYVSNCTGKSCFVNDYVCNSDPSLTSLSISQTDAVPCEFGCDDGACLSEKQLPVACTSFPCFFDAKAINNAWATVDVPPTLVSASYPYEFTLSSSENVDLTFNSNVWPNELDGTNTIYVELNNNVIYSETKTYDQFINDQNNENTIRKINLGTLRAKTHTLKFYASPDPSHFMLDMFVVNKSTPVSVCGDGNIQGSEACDGNNLAKNTCQSVGSFTGGILKCSSSCQFDTSDCYTQKLAINGPSELISGDGFNLTVSGSSTFDDIKIYYDGSEVIVANSFCSQTICYYVAGEFIAQQGTHEYFATAVYQNALVTSAIYQLSVLPNVCLQSTEVCNNLDDDCDGLVDEGLLNTYYRDADGDSYTTDSDSPPSCSPPPSYKVKSAQTDCNDANALVNPGMNEADYCSDGIDNDCNSYCDYDSSSCSHGDIKCPVKIVSIATDKITLNVGETLKVICGVIPDNVTSVKASLSHMSLEYDQDCQFAGWSDLASPSAGFAEFSCVSPSVPGNYGAYCKVDTTRSYLYDPGNQHPTFVQNVEYVSSVVTPQVLYPKATDLVVSQNGYYYMTVKWNNFSSINSYNWVSAYLYKQGVSSYSSSCTSNGGLSCNLSIGGTSGIYQVKLYYRNVNGSYAFVNGDLFNITLQTVCGNAVVEGTEECDKYAFNAKTCGTYGFMYGSLNCTTDCKVISSGCSGIAPKITNPINGTVLINQTNINVTWNNFTRKAGTQSTAYLVRPDGTFAAVVNNGTYYSCSGSLGCILVYPINLPSAYYRIRLDFTNINSVQNSIFGEAFRIN